MSVDVEDYFHVTALSKVIDRDDWDGMEYRAEASTRRLLDLFAATDTRATFFVLGWVARRSPQLVREIHQAGHEVASHGMSHTMLFDQTQREFYAETRDAKALLEDIVGAPVEGYRAATYSITRRTLWALDVLCELGFRYDSSIFPIRHDVYGFPDAPVGPGVINAPAGASIVEFPMSTASLGGVRVPVCGGGYFRLLPYRFTRAGLRSINGRDDRPFIFYVHPWEVDPQQPVIEAPWRSSFRHYTNLGRTEQRLRQLVGEFRFTSVRQVLQGLELLPAPA